MEPTRFQLILSGTGSGRMFNKVSMEINKMNTSKEFFENYQERVKVHFWHHLIAYKKSSIQSNNHKIAESTQMMQFAGPMGYQMRAFAYVGKGDLDSAIADFGAAIRGMPDNDWAYQCRGAVYGEKGNLDQAIADFDTALRIKPNSASSYYYRSLAYLGKGNFDLAFADCEKALKLNLSKDEQLDAYLIRGFLYGRKGDFDKAIKDFETALQIRLNRVMDNTIDIEPDFHNNARKYLEYARQANEEMNPILKEQRLKREQEERERRLKEEQEKREKKFRLEAEKQSLTEQIASLNNEVSAIPEYSEIKKLKEQVEKLTSEKYNIGFIFFKKRKAVQEQIDSINAELEKLKVRVNTTVEEINKRASQIASRMKEIGTELTKLR